MEKKIVLIALFITYFSNCFSQSNSAYLEAIALEKISNSSLFIEYENNIQAFECLSDNEKSTIEDLKYIFENPLEYNGNDLKLYKYLEILKQIDISKCETLNKYKKDEVIKNSITELDFNLKTISQEDTSTNTGYSLTTNIIDGTAKFLVDHSKKEIALTFYDNFKSKIDKNYTITLFNGEINTTVSFKLSDIFSNTILLLSSNESFETPSLGQTYITAFKKDITNMPEQVIDILLNSNFAKTEVGQSIQLSFKLLDLIKEGNSLERSINLLALRFSEYKKYDLHRYIGLIDLTIQNLKKENSEIVDFETFRNLDDRTKIFYIGILFNKLKEQEIIPSEFLLKEEYVLKNVIPKLLNLINNIENISKKTKIIFDENGKLKVDSYLEFATSTLQLSIDGSELTETIFNFNNSKVKITSEKLLSLVKPIKSIYDNFGKKDYGASLLTTINFLDSFLSKNEKNDEIKRLVARYGNFLVDVINAAQKDSEIEVKDVLNSYALPISSYRIKRQFHKSWDISAYPGVYGGYEFSNSNSFSYGITAPIGFSYSRKTNQSLPESSQSNSNSLFFSVIDIGAPFSYRFTKGDAEGLPNNIKWEQIFSPGLFFVKGFKNSPFAISIGGQFTPLLRKIESDLEESNIFRASIGFTVDIPLLNLNRKSKTIVNAKDKEEKSTDVLYGERAKHIEPQTDTYRFFYDKNGQLYPNTIISDDLLKKHQGFLQNYFLNDVSKFKELSSRVDLNFDDYSFENFEKYQDSILNNQIKIINKSISDSTKIFVLIHGFRKPIKLKYGNTTSVKDNEAVKKSIKEELSSKTDVKFIEIYWNGTYECCIDKNLNTNKKIFELFEKQAQKFAINTGYNLRKLLSKLEINQINIITHSLGARVGITALFDAYDANDAIFNSFQTPSQKQVNICLIAPAISSNPFKYYYKRNTKLNYSKNDNYNITVMYNEKDFVLLKKKFKILGPGPLKYGNTSLGCNYKNETIELRDLFNKEFKNSSIEIVEAPIGEFHLLKVYANSKQFKEYVRELK